MYDFQGKEKGKTQIEKKESNQSNWRTDFILTQAKSKTQASAEPKY